MKASTSLVFCCKTCGDAKEKKDMRTSAICRICYRERLKLKGSKKIVFKKICGECNRTVDENTFRLRMMPTNGEHPEVCGFCYETFSCHTCKQPTTRTVAVNGMCVKCQSYMAEIVRREEAPMKKSCEACQGSFEAIEMIDNECIYCAVDAREESRLMEVAKRMRNNSEVYARFKKYVYGYWRLGGDAV